MGFLKLIGAVSAAEHSKLDAKYKAAIKDLATEIEVRETAQSERDRLKDKVGEEIRTGTRLALDLSTARRTIKTHEDTIESMAWELKGHLEEIAALRPDAEKWRDRAARELQRGQAKRDAAAKAFAEATTGMGR